MLRIVQNERRSRNFLIPNSLPPTRPKAGATTDPQHHIFRPPIFIHPPRNQLDHVGGGVAVVGKGSLSIVENLSESTLHRPSPRTPNPSRSVLDFPAPKPLQRLQTVQKSNGFQAAREARSGVVPVVKRPTALSSSPACPMEPTLRFSLGNSWVSGTSRPSAPEDSRGGRQERILPSDSKAQSRPSLPIT